MTTALVLFRRDLRLADHSALNAAARDHDEILPLFVLDDSLLSRWSKASFRLDFLHRCLIDLSAQIAAAGGHLACLSGQPEDVISTLSDRVDALYFNRDYSPLAQTRDRALVAAAKRMNMPVTICDDALLNSPEAVLKADGTPYTVFTPYFRKAAMHLVAEPIEETPVFAQHPLAGYDGQVPHDGSSQVLAAGRSGALALFDRFAGLRYNEARDIPAAAQTTNLSAHLRFGTCSAREVFHAVKDAQGSDASLLRQLYWRDFYTQISYHFPHVYHGAFRRHYDQVVWDNNEEGFDRWCKGETGFPIVDAGMRELLATGFMHNRVRMVVASFLTKNLHISWRRGEAWFAERLIDYDPAANNGNWQWGASTGCDAQPYFRVFNPWRQQVKFDADCEYIKQWVPELRAYPPKVIHQLERKGDFYRPQIVDLKMSAEISKQRFREVKG